jgi:hypothetical protein
VYTKTTKLTKTTNRMSSFVIIVICSEKAQRSSRLEVFRIADREPRFHTTA